jgi:hypothetical protein
MKYRHVAIRRDHVDVVRRYRHPVLSFHNLHRGDPLKDLGQHARMTRIKVGYQHKGHSSVRLRKTKELLKGFQTSG